MKKLLLIFALIFAPNLAHAQLVRISIPFPSISSQYSPLLQANIAPNLPVLAVCHSPANGTPCTNYATTYTSAGVACANGAQDTPDPQPSDCQATGDAEGNLGFWVNPGTYDYTVCIQNTVTCLGPYTVTAAGGAGSIVFQTNGVNNGDQAKLNLHSSDSSVTLTDDGSGNTNVQVPALTTPPQTSNSNTPATTSFVKNNYASVNFGAWSEVPSATAVNNGYGYFQSGQSALGTAATVQPNAAEPPGLEETTSSSASSSAGLTNYPGSAHGLTTIGVLKSAVFTFKLLSNTNIRLWVGLVVPQGSANLTFSALQSDTPNVDFVGVRFSTAASDANYEAISQLKGASTPTQTKVAGPVVDMVIHTLQLQYDGTNVNFILDGTLIAQISSNIPATSEALIPIMVVDNVGMANAESVVLYSYRVVNGG